MPNPQKAKIIEELNDKFQRAKGAVLSDFKGMDVYTMSALRKELRANSVELRVVKNTLAKRAMKGTPFEVLKEHFQGPTSIALSYEDVVAPAKIMTDFAKKAPKLKLTAGYVEGKIIDREGLNSLANLPSREVLLGQVLAVASGPARKFVGTLNAVVSGFVGVLRAIKDKREKE